MKWKKIIPEFISKSWEKWFYKVENALVLFQPTYISKQKDYFSPIVMVVALISIIFCIGIAITSFFLLFTSLLVLYFILSRVFGLDLSKEPIIVV
jgi:hypothetical protein